MRQQVYSYCNEQLQAGEEIELESLSKELAGVSEKTFQEFTAEQGYELEESFPADRSTLRQLTKFAGSGGGLTINFDAMLLGERVFWDPATDTLTIKGTPPNLRDQLQRRTSGSVRAKKRSCRSAAPLPVACATNWQNIPLLKAESCCFASIAIWRWNI